MQGDHVVVELEPPRQFSDPNRRAGRVVSVTSRHNATVVGIFHYGDGTPTRRRSNQRARPHFQHSGGSNTYRYDQPQIPTGFHYVTPLDERITQPILIAPGSELPPPAASSPHRTLGDEALRSFPVTPDTDLEGLAVNVELTSFPSNTRPARGHVIEVLGPPDAFGVDVEIIIRKHHLPHVFPDVVLEEARRLSVELSPDDGVPQLTAAVESGVSPRRRSKKSPATDAEITEPAALEAAPAPRGPDSAHRLISASSSTASVHAPHRRDFRSLPIVTIDGETARDFDDAVLVRPLPHGHTELQVHIADVSHYVRPGSALDAEARERATSVYFPDRAIPMLPHELSSGACSLRPFEDRLVLSAIMHFDENCNRIGYEITHGIIRSAARMTYTKVAAIIDGDSALRAEYMPLVPEFDRMFDFAKRLNRRRTQRGSIDFDLPEPSISFDELGQMESIVRSERNWAHRLIEEFMLAANECVAHHLESTSVPSIYRIHEKPDPAKIMDFEQAASAFGYSLGVGNIPVRSFQLKADHNARRATGSRRGASGRGGSRGQSRDRNQQTRDSARQRAYEIPEDIAVTPQMYQQLAAKISDQPEERILALLMLRSLKQARYSEENAGHFALASDAYTHFTSPIRRYPDLIVHRILTELLAQRGPIAVAEKAGSIKKLSAEKSHASHKGAHDKRGHRANTASRSEEVFPSDAPLSAKDLALIAQHSSEAERHADDAERELIEWKKIRFMEDRVGEEFDALIISATKHGLFIELQDLFIEGLIPLPALADLGERFLYREATRQLIGEDSGRRFAIGDRVRVLLDRIQHTERRLLFALIDQDPIPPPLKHSPHPKPSQKVHKKQRDKSKQRSKRRR
jgi:ribonuclease R